MTLMKSNTEQGSCAQASHLHTPPSAPACLPTCIGLPPALPVQLSSLSTYLLLRLLLPLPMSARLHGAHGPRPLHSQHSTSFLSSSPSSLPLLHLSGCTFRFNFVAIMHAKVQCFVGILFTQPPLYDPLPPASAPACWHFIACFIYSSVSSVSLTPFLTQRQLK